MDRDFELSAFLSLSFYRAVRYPGKVRNLSAMRMHVSLMSQ